MRLLMLALVALFLVPQYTEGQEVVDRIGSAVAISASGGSVGISQGLRTVSGASSLELEWFVVNDSTLSVVFSDPVGAKGDEDDGWFSYQVDMHMHALAPVKAFEVRIVTFNVWRQFTGTLSFTQLEDLESSQEKSFERRWGYHGESQLRAHRTSIAYVARVMLDNGQVVVADPELVLKLAKEIQESVTLQDLEPAIEPLRYSITE